MLCSIADIHETAVAEPVSQEPSSAQAADRPSTLAVVVQALRKAGAEGQWSWQQDSKQQQSTDIIGNDADSLALHHGSGRPVWPATDQGRG